MPGPAITFAPLTQAPMSDLDLMFQTISQCVPISCINSTVSGNNISLTAGSLSPAVTSYFNFLRLQFEPNATTTGPVSVQFSGLNFLPVYKPGGTQAGSGDISFGVLYDIAFCSNLGTVGGWLIMNAGTATAGVASIADATNGGMSFSGASGAVSASVAPGDLSAKSLPDLSDLLMIGDSQSSNAPKSATFQAFATQTVILYGTASNGVNGGALTNGAFTQRVIVSKYDPSGLCTLAANQFTLANGYYDICGYVLAACTSGAFKTTVQLKNVTNSSVVLGGSSGAGPANTNTPCFISDNFFTTGTPTLQLESFVNSTNCIEGIAVNAGNIEVYIEMKFTRVQFHS